MTAADLRFMAGRPASLCDVLEAWITTHPRKGGEKGGSAGALSALMSQAGDPAKVLALFGG